MTLLAFIIGLLLVCFGGVILVGAPYLPTLSLQITRGLELSKLQPGQTLLELGCGDGRVLVSAARRGAQVVGYELNPLLAAIAWIRTRRYKGKVRVVWGNFWQREWPRADVIFVFLYPRYMAKLDKKCMQYTHKPVTLVSIAFRIPNKRPILTQKDLHIYRYK